MPLWAQANPHQVLRDALNLENHGNFEPAAKIGKLAIDCGQLAGTELGRAYIILGVAYQGEGSLIDAQIAYERVVHILEGDPDHLEGYAAPENYAGYYTDLAQLEIAVRLWSKAFHPAPANWRPLPHGTVRTPQRVLIKNGNTRPVIPVNDIELIEAAAYYVCLHARGRNTCCARAFELSARNWTPRSSSGCIGRPS